MDERIRRTPIDDARASDVPMDSMSGLGPDEDAEPDAGGRPFPMGHPRRARSDGGPAISGPTGMIGGFDQPVLDRPTIGEDLAPQRGTPETES